MLPSTDNLRCFEAAARLLSFRAAAAAVALTPAAFGQRIKQLEEQLGVPLFRRTTRSVRLTDAGFALLPEARRALAALGECVHAARGDVGPPPVELTLGTRFELGLSFVVPNLEKIRGVRAGLTVHLYFGSGPDLLLRLRSREIDCAFTSSRVADPKLDAAVVHREDYVFVGARSLLAGRPLRRDADAAAHTLIDAGSDLPLFSYWRNAPEGGRALSFASILRAGSTEAIRQLVLRGEGVAVLPSYLVRGDLRRRRLRLVFPRVTPLADRFRLIFRADDPQRTIYEQMGAAMRELPLR